jgi:arsenate reductase
MEPHMSRIIIYQKPTCSTCRQAVQLLHASGQPFTLVNYYKQRFTKTQLKQLLRKAGLSPKDVLRTKEDVYKELGLAKATLKDDELIDLMVAHPDLLQRPLVEKGDKALLARPADKVRGVL